MTEDHMINQELLDSLEKEDLEQYELTECPETTNARERDEEHTRLGLDKLYEDFVENYGDMG